MGNTAILVEHLSKQYTIRQGKRAGYETLRGALVQAASAPLRLLKNNGQDKSAGNTIWALKDVSFEVKKGEAIGIIGRNGAGKSTLLKILSRITDPTEGRARLYGRVGSLLEVGTGFHPELTGRENIFLNGAILGMAKREIEKKFDEMVDFAEVEKFIDMPVKHYSSGMYLRLAFAVAAHLEPEILLVDEVLAVGDAAFQKKCLGKMQSVTGEGRTVLFVSHNMAAVNSLCPSSFVLQQGRLIYQGNSGQAISFYLSDASKSPGISLEDRTDRTGNGRLRICGVYFTGTDDTPLQILYSGADILTKIRFEIPGGKVLEKCVCIIVFKNHLGQPLFSCSTRLQNDYLPPLKSKGQIICKIPKFPLNQGTYFLDLLVKQGADSKNILDFVEDAAQVQVVQGDFYGTGRSANIQSSPVLVEHEWDVESL